MMNRAEPWPFPHRPRRSRITLPDRVALHLALTLWQTDNHESTRIDESPVADTNRANLAGRSMNAQEWRDCAQPHRMIEALPQTAGSRRKLRRFLSECVDVLEPSIRSWQGETILEVIRTEAYMQPNSKGTWAEAESMVTAQVIRTYENSAHGWSRPLDQLEAERGQVWASSALRMALLAVDPKQEAATTESRHEESAGERPGRPPNGLGLGTRQTVQSLESQCTRISCWTADAIDHLTRAEALRRRSPQSLEAVPTHIAAEGEAAKRREFRRQADLLRELVGEDPQQTLEPEPDWLIWNDGLVLRIAETITRDHDFEAMPILADALEEAGCEERSILDHLRGPGPHRPGCWVLDLLEEPICKASQGHPLRNPKRPSPT